MTTWANVPVLLSSSETVFTDASRVSLVSGVSGSLNERVTTNR